MVIKYDFAKEFSPNPGLRFETMTPGISGEKFRDEILEKVFKNGDQIIIDVSGIESNLGSSFLSEAFGNIAVKYGIDRFNEIIEFDRSTQKGEVTYQEMMKRVKEALIKAKK